MDIGNLKESPLVAGALEARRPTHWWLAYPLSIIVPLFVVGSVVNLVLSPVIQSIFGIYAGQALEAFTSAAMVLTLAAWVRFKEGRPVSSLGFRGNGAVKRFLYGLVIGAGMLALSVLLLVVLGQYRQVEPKAGTVSGAVAIVPFILLLLHWGLQAPTEETISRGYQLQVGGVQLPGWLAILLPGIIFSGLHFVDSGLSEPVAIVNIILYALFATFVALRQGSLWMAGGIHAGWNWMQGNGFGVPVSGNDPYSSSLVYMGPTDNAIHFLSGGSFGPEGSLVVTFVWGVALIISYRYFKSGPKVQDTPPAG